MVMFLMVLCMSVFGLAICGLAFGAATPRPAGRGRGAADGAVDERLAAVPERFFVRDVAPQPVPAARLVRKCRSRCSSPRSNAISGSNRPPPSRSWSAPSLESLHGRTVSPLVH